MCKVLPDGGVDALDTSVYWLLPNGETKCCSARMLHKDRSRMGLQPDSKDEYEAIGSALGFSFLGGRCDVTDLLADLGTLQEQKWATLQWQLPISSMDACWWLTNPPLQDTGASASSDLSATPQLMCKSLAYLRVELHQTRVANMSKLRAERHRRRSQNIATVQRLEETHIGSGTRVQSSGTL